MSNAELRVRSRGRSHPVDPPHRHAVRQGATTQSSLDRAHRVLRPHASVRPKAQAEWASRAALLLQPGAPLVQGGAPWSRKRVDVPIDVIHEEAGLSQGHGLRGVGLLAAGGGSGSCGEAPVIHPAARGGPECRAGLGGSIKWAAVLVGARPDKHASSPEQRKVSGARGAFKWSTGAHGAAVRGRALAGPGAWRQRISPSRRP